MFKPYQSIPITRMAFQLNESMMPDIKKVGEATYTLSLYEDVQVIQFKAYEEPLVGDWIVRLTDIDTYHVTDKVFRERNVVSDTLDENGEK